MMLNGFQQSQTAIMHRLTKLGAIAEYPTTLATPCFRLCVYALIALQVHWRQQGYASSVSASWIFYSQSSLKKWLSNTTCLRLENLLIVLKVHLENWLRVYAMKIYS